MMNKGNMSRVNKRKAGKMVDMENIWKAAGIPLGAQLKVIIEDGKVIFEMDNNPKNKTGVARNILANAKGHPLFAYANDVTFCAVTIDGRTRTGQAVLAPNDYPFKDVGDAIAYLRAVGEPIPEILIK